MTVHAMSVQDAYIYGFALQQTDMSSQTAEDLAAEGMLDAALCDRYILPVYARTPTEARSALEGPSAPLRDHFEVLHCRTDPVANPYLEQWRADGDAAAYGRAYSAFVRAFTESSVREHLFAPGARTGDAVDAASAEPS